MSCAQVGQLLQQYLDGHLHQRDSARLVAHLDDCRRCGLEVEAYTRIKDSLAARHGDVPADSLRKLREFGERLARGEVPPLA